MINLFWFLGAAMIAEERSSRGYLAPWGDLPLLNSLHSYGFTKVFTPLDVLAWDPRSVLTSEAGHVLILTPSLPSIWPFHKLTEAERGTTRVRHVARANVFHLRASNRSKTSRSYNSKPSL